MKFAVRLAQLGRIAPLASRIEAAARGPYPLSEDFLQRAAVGCGRFIRTASKHWQDAGSVTEGKAPHVAERIATAADSAFPLSHDFPQRAAAATLARPYPSLAAAAAFHPTPGVSPTHGSDNSVNRPQGGGSAAAQWSRGASTIDEHGRTIGARLQTTRVPAPRLGTTIGTGKYGGDSLGEAYQQLRGLCSYTAGGAFCADTAKH